MFQGHRVGRDTHAKFTNYYMDVNDFMMHVHQAVQHVLGHPSFQEARLNRSGKGKSKEEL